MALAQEPTATALGTMAKVADAPNADPSFSTSNEDSGRLAFETGGSTFMVNYPFVYPSAKENAPDVFKNMEAARYPRVVADMPSKPPLGGIILGVSAFSNNKPAGFRGDQVPDPARRTSSRSRPPAGLPPVDREPLRGRSRSRRYTPASRT